MSEHGGGAIDLATSTIGIDGDGKASLLQKRAGPPQRIEGLTVGAPAMSQAPPHGGEMHPDGDEVLFLISGRITVVLEDDDPPTRVDLGSGQAVVVPRGIWHRIELREPSQLLHITPGPGGQHRPLQEQ